MKYSPKQHDISISYFSIKSNPFTKKYKNFKKKLKQVEPPLVSEFVKLYNEMYREIPFENTEAFICGFRTGARMMLEVMEEEH